MARSHWCCIGRVFLSVVMARPAGFSFYGLLPSEVVVKASQTRRKQGSVFFSAPKTPKGQLPRDATDMMWALSVRAAMHSFVP